MPGPDADVLQIQQRCNIMRMTPLDIEADDPAVTCRILRSVNGHMLLLCQTGHQPGCQFLFLLPDPVKPHGLQIADRSMKTYRIGRIDRPCLEPVRDLRERCPFSCDILDHLSAPQERRHLLKQFHLPVQNTDPHRSEHLVSGKRKEVSIDLIYIHRHMGYRLRSVHHYDRTVDADDLRKTLLEEYPDVIKEEDLEYLESDRDTLESWYDTVMDLNSEKGWDLETEYLYGTIQSCIVEDQLYLRVCELVQFAANYLGTQGVNDDC